MGLGPDAHQDTHISLKRHIKVKALVCKIRLWESPRLMCFQKSP